MKLFLDTADVESIADSFETGLVDGVTTNPTLMMKSGRNPDDVYQELINLGVPDKNSSILVYQTLVWKWLVIPMK